MERFRGLKKLAALMSAVMLFTSIFNGNVSTLRAEEGQPEGGQTQIDETTSGNNHQEEGGAGRNATHKISFTISGSGRVDYWFYDSSEAQCEAGGTGQISTTSDVEIPANAVKVKIEAVAGENYHGGSASGIGLDNAIFSQGGKTVAITAGQDESVSISFEANQSGGNTEGGNQGSGNHPPVLNPGDIGISLNGAGDGSYVKYSFDKTTWANAGDVISKDTIGGNTTIYFIMVPNDGQKIDDWTDGNGGTNHKWWINTDGATQTCFSNVDLENGNAAITGYDNQNSYRAEFNFQNKSGNSNVNTREVTINLIPDLSGYSNESSTFGLNINVRQSDGGDLGGGTNIGFKKSDDGKTKTGTVNVPDNAAHLTVGAITAGQNVESASYQINGTGEFISLSNEQIGELVSQTGFSIPVGSGESQVNSVTMKVKIVPNNGQQGGNPDGNGEIKGNLSINRDHVSKVLVSVQNTDENWTTFTELTGDGIALKRYQHFKVKLVMDEQYQVVLDGNSFRYRDKQNRNNFAEYFSAQKNPTELNAIAEALVGENGYEMVYDPESASSSAGGEAALSSENSVIEIQYDARIVYEQSPEIYIYFQEKNGEEYGVWETIEGRDTFVDGADWGEIEFMFNQNRWGGQGSPDKLGFGISNKGALKIKYTSKLGESNGSSVELEPRGYDHFTVGGYTNGETKNVFEYDDYDNLIDEMYIVAGDSADFSSAKAVKATVKHDDGRNVDYNSYKVELDPASKYQILLRKHRSMNASLKWSYNETDRNDDFYVDHGKVYIEEIKRGGTVVLGEISMDQDGNIITNGGIPTYSINTGNFNTGSSTGNDIFVEVGDVVTIRMIPDYGYQIAGAVLNGTKLEPNETKSSFTFTVGGNLHLAGSFAEAHDIINTDGADTVNTANITNGENATDSGCLSLEVKTNTTYDENKINQAKSKAITDESNYSSATTFATLDLTLDQMVSKGTEGDYWEENITSFKDDITVEMKLNDLNYMPGDTYVVVREHNGTLEKINASFESGCLKVPTNRFSTYTVVKLSANDDDRPNIRLECDYRDFPSVDGQSNRGSISVIVEENALEEIPDGYYKYDDATKPITFKLTRPKDREDEKYVPVVCVEFPREDQDPIVINPTITKNKFTVTPSQSGLDGTPYMEVFVWWSAYDQFGPAEDQFMVEVENISGGGEIYFSGAEPSGSINQDCFTKYTFPKGSSPVAYFVPSGPGFELQNVRGSYWDNETFSFIEYEYAKWFEEESPVVDIESLYNSILNRYELPTDKIKNYCINFEFCEIPYVVEGSVAASPETLYPSMKQSDVTLTGTVKLGAGTTIAGRFFLIDSDDNLLIGTNPYRFAFESEAQWEDGKPKYVLEGEISLTVVESVVESIKVTTPPTKTTYIYGESLDTTGIVVTATYSDGSTQEVTTVTYEGDIKPSNTSITVKYGEKETTFSIKVNKATPTITLSNLNETTQNPTGVKATLSPADTSASVKIEYEVVTTPAKPEQACKYAKGHLQDCASLSDESEICDCGYSETHKHDSNCGYKEAVEEVREWTTERPTVAGTYPVRVILPNGTTCLLAVTEPVTGTYTLTAYQAPATTPVPEQPKAPEKSQAEIAMEKAVAEYKAAVEADLKEEITPIDMNNKKMVEELPADVAAVLEKVINAIAAFMPVKQKNAIDTTSVVQTMDISSMKTETGFTTAMVKSAESFEKSNCEVGVVYTGDWVFMNRNTAKAWEEVDIDIIWIFEHKGITFKVTIPKGTDLTAILNEDGYAGPLYIGKVLGTCEVID